MIQLKAGAVNLRASARLRCIKAIARATRDILQASTLCCLMAH
ncbi:hypothetical protein [Methylobacterium sp. 13MFTsu3.1M2]|nr:hypothetical protein [Methylobacterium sp. 13MFTsu3.1M2]